MRKERGQATDAEYEIVDLRRPQFRWKAVIWWTIYVGGFAYGAYNATGPWSAAIAVVGAALYAPFVRWLSTASYASTPDRFAALGYRLTGRRPPIRVPIGLTPAGDDARLAGWEIALVVLGLCLMLNVCAGTFD